jgi:hypothetical protein
VNFIDFSNTIIESNDIDPDYIFFINYKKKYGADKTMELFKKKLLIYNLHSELLYTDGHICADEIKFGSERQKNKRYFLDWESNLNKVDFKRLYKFHGVDYLIFRDNFKKIKGMGDWACWKAADILDKVFGVKMKFDEMTFLHAYQFPLKGLLMLNNRAEDVRIYRDKKIYLHDLSKAKSISKNIKKNSIWDASNILELETLLCKFHSFAHKHYKPNEDVNKLRKIKLDDRLSHYHDLLP